MGAEDKLKRFLQVYQEETAKAEAAQCMLEAKCKEVEAAVHLSDWAAMERARQAAVAAFEHLIDTRVAMTRHLKRQAEL